MCVAAKGRSVGTRRGVAWLCAGAWRCGGAAWGGAKRSAGRRGAVANCGVGTQTGAALWPGMRCRQRGALCRARLAHYVGLVIWGGGVWSCQPDLTVLVHSAVSRAGRTLRSGLTPLSRARAGAEGRCRDLFGPVQAMHCGWWCVDTLGRRGCGCGVGRGAALRRPQAVSARQLRGRAGKAQCETRRRSVAWGSASAPRGAAHGQSAGTRRGAGQGRAGARWRTA